MKEALKQLIVETYGEAFYTRQKDLMKFGVSTGQMLNADMLEKLSNNIIAMSYYIEHVRDLEDLMQALGEAVSDVTEDKWPTVD